MNSLLLNDIALSEDIKNAFFALDENVVTACDMKAKEICANLFPDIDFGRQENIDLVIRPLSATIAINELILQNLFSESTLDGIRNSKTLPSSMKSAMLKNFASLNGIRTASSDPESLYSEISFFIKNNNLNRRDIFSNSILEEFSSIDRLFFADTAEVEMIRNMIPYIQIDHIKVMNFSRSEFNGGTLVGTGYSRDDYQRFQDYKSSDRVSIPGVLDVYFSTPLIKEDIVLTRSGKYYELPAGYYISIENDKDFVVLENDIFSYGITKDKVVLFMPEGDDSETFSVVKYDDPLFESYSKNEELSITDILYKGFYPLFVDFTIYTRDDIDIHDLKLNIDAYLALSGGNMTEISINDMQNYLKARGLLVTVSPKTTSRLFSSINMPIPMDAIFPLSVKDISIPPEFDSAIFTERTIKVFSGELNVTKE